MPSPDKPVICIVHGAWHRPFHYINLINPLRSKEYTVVAPALPTTGLQETIGKSTVADCAAVIRTSIKDHLDAGREIVMVSHSFGGLPATDSVVGETVNERREKGLAGGVKAVVYIAAFAPPAPGMSLFKIIGIDDESAHPPWWNPKGELAILDHSARDLLYNDIDKSLAQMAMDITMPQGIISNISPCAHGTSEIAVPKIYFAAKNDLVVPYEGQKAMAQAASAQIIELECGHSPFLKETETALIVDVIEKAAM